MHLSAVILAGGKSSRMGRDKAWLQHHGRPLIVHQIETVRHLRPAEVFISAPAERGFANLGWPVLVDNFPGEGPLAGIERALEAMQSPMLLVLAVDMPRMKAATLRHLLERCSEERGAVPRIGERLEPLAAFYPRSVHRSLLLSLGEGRKGAARFAELCVAVGQSSIVDVPASARSDFTNWNSPADIAPQDHSGALLQ